MNFMLYRRQPQVKTISSTEKNVPLNVFNERSINYIPFKSQPIKHWRKQLSNNNDCKKVIYEEGHKSVNLCGDCDPKKRIIRSGRTNNKNNYHHSTKSYLNSKAISCDTNISVSQNIICNGEITTTERIEKYNNHKYSQQGAVSSSTRIIDLNRLNSGIKNSFLDRSSGVCVN